MGEAKIYIREDEGLIEVYALPAVWTPEHVLHRMVCAFETLAATNENIGPKGYGSCMPAYIRDFADEVNARSEIAGESATEAEARFNTDNALRAKPRPSAHEVTLMLDAFAWPGRYLAQLPKHRVQIAKWARRRAAKGEGTGAPITAVFAEAMTIARGLRSDRRAVE